MRVVTCNVDFVLHIRCIHKTTETIQSYPLICKGLLHTPRGGIISDA